jgi:hypothetical protein
MKHRLKLTTIVFALIANPLAFAKEKHPHDYAHGDDHHHEEPAKKGPNGGQIVQSKAGFAFEVTVDKQRKARIVFLDKNQQAVALAAQSIQGIAGERSAPLKLIFAKGAEQDANVLISDKALPAGDHVQMILTIKTAAAAKPVTERFVVHLH